MVKRILVVIVCVIAVIGLATFVWIVTMPYPLGVWWQARTRTQYCSDWPASKAEFLAAENLVRREMKFREIMFRVTIRGQNEIEFETLSYYKGLLAAAGQVFVVKKVNGKWTIVSTSLWMS